MRAIATQHAENVVRAWAVDTLRAIRQPVVISNDMLFSTDVSLRRAAYRAWAKQEPDRAAVVLLARIEEEGFDDFDDTIGRLRVPSDLDEKLFEALNGSGRGAVRASGALAVHADRSMAVRLFRTPSRAIRSAAEMYVTANPRLDAILRTVAAIPGYPSESVMALQQAVARRNELAKELMHCPAWARAWRARNIAARRSALVARPRTLTSGEVL